MKQQLQEKPELISCYIEQIRNNVLFTSKRNDFVMDILQLNIKHWDTYIMFLKTILFSKYENSINHATIGERTALTRFIRNDLALASSQCIVCNHHGISHEYSISGVYGKCVTEGCACNVFSNSLKNIRCPACKGRCQIYDNGVHDDCYNCTGNGIFQVPNACTCTFKIIRQSVAQITNTCPVHDEHNIKTGYADILLKHE